MMRWCKIRHDLGFVFHEGYDINPRMEDERFAIIHPNDKKSGKKYTAQYLDHTPFTCRTIKDAKLNLEAIHASKTR